MDDKLLKYLIDPVMSKILLEINRSGRITVKELCTLCSDIPRSSMYRHLTRLERDGFVEVVDRHQVRGTVEKTYALCEGTFLKNSEMPPEVTPDTVVDMFFSYCMEFVKMFQDFAATKPDISTCKEVTGFYTAPVYATDKEITDAMTKIGDVLTELASNTCTEGRKKHSIGLIISPPKIDD